MEVPLWLHTILTIFITTMGSSGFWVLATKLSTRKDASTQLLLGLAHDRIITMGMAFIMRGWITKDEYQDFMRYLYEPYSKFGGNGLAEKVVSQVKDLKMYNHNPKNWKPETDYEKYYPGNGE